MEKLFNIRTFSIIFAIFMWFLPVMIQRVVHSLAISLLSNSLFNSQQHIDTSITPINLTRGFAAIHCWGSLALGELLPKCFFQQQHNQETKNAKHACKCYKHCTDTSHIRDTWKMPFGPCKSNCRYTAMLVNTNQRSLLPLTNKPSGRWMSLNRSQYGSCSTKHNTTTGT